MPTLPKFIPDYVVQLIKEFGLTEYVDAGECPPPEPGVYLCKVEGLIAPQEGFSKFDGKNWSYSFSSPIAAAISNCLSYLSKPSNVTRYWRGLASNPNVLTDTRRSRGAMVINLAPKEKT